MQPARIILPALALFVALATPAESRCAPGLGLPGGGQVCCPRPSRPVPIYNPPEQPRHYTPPPPAYRSPPRAPEYTFTIPSYVFTGLAIAGLVIAGAGLIRLGLYLYDILNFRRAVGFEHRIGSEPFDFPHRWRRK